MTVDFAKAQSIDVNLIKSSFISLHLPIASLKSQSLILLISLYVNSKYYVGIRQKYLFPNSVYATRSLLSVANPFSVAARNWRLFNRDRLLFNSGDADLFYLQAARRSFFRNICFIWCIYYSLRHRPLARHLDAVAFRLLAVGD